MNSDTRAALERPFSGLKTRPGRSGQQLTYVEACQVIDRLNEAFSSDWTFRILDHQVLEREVVVVGELEAAGTTKQAFGGSDITKSRDGGQPVCIADDLKSAATDALKKAATLLGVGLHLYGGNTAADSGANGATDPGKGRDGARGANGTGANRLSRKQHSYIQTLAREQGMDRGALEQLSRDRFGRVSSYISVKDASALIDELRQGGSP